MMHKKAQAAMEFLMTYGWAILVVLAAIGALAYFGVLSPDRFLPQSCTVTGGFSCLDEKVSSTDRQVRFKIVNNLGVDALNANVSITSADCTSNGTFMMPTPFANRGEQQVTFQCSENPLQGAVQADISISYIRDGGTEVRIATGSITGRAEA